MLQTEFKSLYQSTLICFLEVLIWLIGLFVLWYLIRFDITVDGNITTCQIWKYGIIKHPASLDKVVSIVMCIYYHCFINLINTDKIHIILQFYMVNWVICLIIFVSIYIPSQMTFIEISPSSNFVPASMDKVVKPSFVLCLLMCYAT